MASSIARIIHNLQATPVSTAAIIGGLSLLLLFLLRRCLFARTISALSKLPRVPAIPGVPVIGNLLQLKEKKPYKTFTNWAGEYGPIYSIRTGASTLVVLSSTEVAKEAMVTRFSSISTRKLPNALKTLSSNKCMVAMSDYNDFHKTVKRQLLAGVLGASAHKRNRHHREAMAENVTNRLHAYAEEFPATAVNFRAIFRSELFGFALKQALGKDIDSVYVDELGETMSREEIFKVLVLDMMEGAIEVDWRDFFPYLRWIPNKRIDDKLSRLALRKTQVMRSLVRDQKERIASSEKGLMQKQEADCYLEYLVTKAKGQSEEQISMLVWEDIIETSDTILVVTEWALFQLSNHPDIQDRLYHEIKSVFGSEKLTEDRLSEVPYLMAVFHESLRKHAPVSILPLRYAHEDTQLGGYYIPAGTEIAINIYGCNMDENQWERPDEWRPERFLEAKYDAMDMYKTMAFGAGKRICAGSLLAAQISCTAIGRLVQEFVWRLTDGEEDNVDTLAFTGRKLRPLHAILKPRH